MSDAGDDRDHRAAKRISRALRLAAKLVVAGLVLFVPATLWLLRDPVPRFAERRSSLTSIREGPTERAGSVVSQPVRLTASSGLSVDLVVRATEEGAGQAPSLTVDSTARRPLFLILGGYRTGERAAMLVEDPGDAVVAAMGYPFDGPTDLSGVAVVWHLPAIRSAILDTPPAIHLALDYLLGRPEVDTTRVELVGVSFGAFFAPVATALDPRVTRLWLIHGAGDPRAVVRHGLRGTVPPALPRAIVASVANIVFAGPRLAPELWLPRVAPRPVVMINASEDERLPPEAVRALHASAREPMEQIWVAGQHLHPTRESLIRELMDIVLSRAADEAR